jgi:hypothetical protein
LRFTKQLVCEEAARGLRMVVFVSGVIVSSGCVESGKSVLASLHSGIQGFLCIFLISEVPLCKATGLVGASGVFRVCVRVVLSCSTI